MALVLFQTAGDRAEQRRRTYTATFERAKAQQATLASDPTKLVATLATVLGAEGDEGLAQVRGSQAMVALSRLGRGMVYPPTQSVIQTYLDDK